MKINTIKHAGIEVHMVHNGAIINVLLTLATRQNEVIRIYTVDGRELELYWNRLQPTLVLREYVSGDIKSVAYGFVDAVNILSELDITTYHVHQPQ